MAKFGQIEPWFTREDVDVGTAVRETVTRLRDIDKWRAGNARRNLYRIEPAPLSRARDMWLSGTDAGSAPLQMRLRLARVQVETQAADVCGRQQPRVMFLTHGADWKTVRRAKRLQRFVDGMFSAPGPGYSSVRELAVEVFRDAGGVWGTGLIRPRATATGIVYQRVWAHECFVDESDARHGNPWQWFCRSRLSRHEALQLWPDREQVIAEAEAAPPAEEDAGFGETSQFRRGTVDEIIVYEAWLRGTPEHPGRYVAAVGDAVLADDPFTRERFPFAVLRWAPPRCGFWGHSLTDEVRELEDSFNDGLHRADEDAKLRNTRDVFIPDGSVRRNEDLAANESINIIELTGTNPPIVSQMPALDNSVYQFLIQRYSWAFEMTGTSQQLATAQRAPGISSAEGQRTVRDLGTQRQALRARAWETFFVDLALATIDVVREYARENPGYAIRWPGKRFLETIKWHDVDIADDQFSATVEPASNLPREPGGVLSAIQDMYGSGLISPDTAKRLLQWPDLEREQSLEQAEADYLEDLVERFLDWDGESDSRKVYEAPDGYLSDLPRALVFMGRSYYQAKRDRAPAANLDLIRRWIDELELMIERMQAPPEAAPQEVPEVMP